MKKINIKLTLEISKVNDKSMSLCIKSNNIVVFEKTTFDQNNVNIKFETNFPAKIELITSGKTADDCVIDLDGNIIRDTYIKIVNFSIDYMSVKYWMIDEFLFSGTADSGESYITNYIGYNGKTTTVVKGKHLFDYFLNLLSKNSQACS